MSLYRIYIISVKSIKWFIYFPLVITTYKCSLSVILFVRRYTSTSVLCYYGNLNLQVHNIKTPMFLIYYCYVSELKWNIWKERKLDMIRYGNINKCVDLWVKCKLDQRRTKDNWTNSMVNPSIKDSSLISLCNKTYNIVLSKSFLCKHTFSLYENYLT